MQFVYILKSSKTKTLYIGCTDNLDKRLQEHNKGLSQATKPYIPWQVVYYEAYLSRGKSGTHPIF